MLVKRHPFCQSRRVEAELAELAQTFENFQVVDASIHELIERAECVVGCNSGVLFEALVLGARVISFGSSDFQVATTSVSKLDDLVDVVFGDDVQDQEFRLRFLGWYLSEYCINASDIDEIEERIRAALESLDIPQSTLNARQEERYSNSGNSMRNCAEIRKRDGEPPGGGLSLSAGRVFGSQGGLN